MFQQSLLRKRFGRFAKGLLCLLGLLIVGGLSGLAGNSALAQTPNLTGTIAYNHNGDTIRLIDADGTNDRRLWAPAPNLFGVTGLDWSPDGSTLAFTSNHERACSVFDGDVYTIQPNGTNLRRLTNGPACAELATYPKGSITLEIESQVSDESLFFVYVEGAPEAVGVTLGFGEVKEITINNVADLGTGLFQRTSASVGHSRWVDPSVAVDVIAGGTAKATTRLILRPTGHYAWTASHPSWRHDGAMIGFIQSEGVMAEVPINPGIGNPGNVVPLSDGSSLGSVIVRSPVANKILYVQNSGFDIYLADLETGAPSQLLVEIPDTHLVYGVDWLPDGSGFVFAVGEGEFLDETVNLYEYTFATGGLTKLTNFTSEVAAHPSVSPDGQYIVYAYQPSMEAATAELYIMARDGSNSWALGVEGVWPDWSPTGGGNSTPTPTTQPTATPTPIVTATPLPATNLIQNGDFESGDLRGWIVPDDSTATTIDGAGYAGNHAAYFGGIDNADEYFYQQIDLPNSGNRGTLSFWINQFGEETLAGADRFCAAIFDANSVDELYDLGCLDGVEALGTEYDAEQWWQARYEFTGNEWALLRGRSIYLTFQMYTDDSLLSTVFIDNVLFQVDSGNAPTPTPTALPTTAPGAGRAWTAMVYLAVDNNLCGDYPELINRMEQELGAKIGPSGFLNIIVQIDHHPAFCNGLSNTTRFVVQPNGNYTPGVNWWDMGEINMGDPQTLVEFATWAMQSYPADHYYLSIDNHGNGIAGIASDDTNGHDMLSVPELHDALSAITNNGQTKLDLFAYEACLMNIVENVYDISAFTDYIFGFPTTSWTNRASYPSYFGDSRFTATTDGATLGDIVFDVYYNAVELPYVVSLIESQQTANLQNALNGWASALQSALGTNRDTIAAARSAAQKMDTNDDNRLTDDDAYIDLWDLANQIAQRGIAVAESNALKAAIEQAVRRVDYRPAISQINVDYGNAHGLSIFWPQSALTPYPYSEYISGQLYEATVSGSWDNFLDAYLGNNSGRRGMSASVGLVDRGDGSPISVPGGNDNQIFLPIVVR